MGLTPDQLRVVTDRHLLLAKTDAATALTATLRGLAGPLCAEARRHAPGWAVPAGFDPAAFQVARGENLDGTPYQYLDCPRCFSRDEMLAFRLLVWWGRAVSACWLLKGERLPVWRERLAALRPADLPDGFGLWLGAGPWDWEGFVPWDGVDRAAILGQDHLKLGVRRDLSAAALTTDGLRGMALAAFRAGLPLLSA